MAGAQDLVPHFDPKRLQARWVLGGISGAELVEQAVLALQQGFNGLALQQLAGFNKPTITDLGNLPDRAFANLGLEPLSREQAATLLAAQGEASDLIFPVLQQFPGFSERWRKHVEWWAGEPAGPYNDMAEFVHYVVEDLYEGGTLEDVRRAFEFMGRLLSGGNPAIRDVIALGFFETLQNVASWRPYGNKVFEQFLDSTCEQVWKELLGIWAGKSSLMDVLRAERQRE